MYDKVADPLPTVHDSQKFLAYLNEHEWETPSVIWTLHLARYQVCDCCRGPYASTIGERLRGFLGQKIAGAIERVSIAGVIAGRTTLMTGEQLPLIYPEIRGMHSWNTSALVGAVVGKEPSAGTKNLKEEFASTTAGLRRFLQKVYHELRNLGQSSRDRAINYAATKAFEVGNVFDNETKAERQLHSIDAEPSLACRLGSDCWDVILSFFLSRTKQPAGQASVPLHGGRQRCRSCDSSTQSEWTSAD